MSTPDTTVPSPSPDQLGPVRLRKLAPRPTTLRDSGLSRDFLADLAAKHLFTQGVLSLSELARHLRLAGPIVEQVMEFMRADARLEVRPNRSDKPGLSYALTERGRNSALDALLRSGYVGPAPVPVKHYARITRMQSIHQQHISRAGMCRAFDDVVIDQSLLDSLGTSMNSGRAVFLYGPAGTGKTYVSQRLARIFPDLTLIPHAVAVADNVIQVFDPLVHRLVERGKDAEDHDYMLDRGHDPRFLVCERPALAVGGELTAEMLEVRYEPSAKTYEAPLQMKANNGVFIIDDLGRQRIEPMALFNRWIVPLEEKRDFLSLASGRHFSVPFDVVLVLSTNIHPLELADEAFLRRIGYKIEFAPVSAEDYERIWRDTCMEYEVDFDPDVLDYVINDLHSRHCIDLLPCHPRDLIGMAIDHVRYTEDERYVDIASMQWAWSRYFVSLEDKSRTASLQTLA